MAGLLNGVLPYVYSRGNALARLLSDVASNPFDSAQQTAGLIRDKDREQQNILAQAFSNRERPFQVTDSNALQQAAMNMLNGPLGLAPAGMAQLIKPLGTGAHYATDNLAEYTPKLYRETSVDRATEFLPNSMSNPQQLWFSNEPAYALGQGANRGVMMEFDAKGIPGKLSLNKPMARQQYESGNAEFVANDIRPDQIGGNLQTIRVAPDQQRGPYFRRVQGLLKDWAVSREADGSIVFTRPGS